MRVWFSGNSSTGSGGGISIDTHGTAVFDGTLFQDNSALVGGAVYWQNAGYRKLAGTPSALTITNARFVNNSGNTGGALYIDVDPGQPLVTRIDQSLFERNLARQGSGGAIVFRSGSDFAGAGYSIDLTITNSSFIANESLDFPLFEDIREK